MGDPGGATRSIDRAVGTGGGNGGRRSGLDDVGHRGEEAVEESVTQRTETGDLRLPISGGETGRHRHGHDPGDVLRPGATAPFLTPTDLQGSNSGRGTDHERTDPLRATELVGTHVEQVDVAGDMREVGPAEGLDRIGMEHGVGCVPADELGDAVEGLEGADLVVDRHHRDQTDTGPLAGLPARRLGGEHLDQLLGVESSGGIDTDHPSTQLLHRIEHGVMLDRTAHDDTGGDGDRIGAGPARREHREVVRLGPTARVDDVAGEGAEELGEFLAGLIDRPTSIPGPSMGAGGVGVAIGEERQHGLDRVGSHRPGGRMVEVGTHDAKGTGGPSPHRTPTRQTAAVTDDAALYGDSFADVYDDWYADMFDTAGAVRTLVALAGPGPVCELGVGTGRLAIPLTEHGLEVIGIDASAAMLDRLRSKEPSAALTAVLGDMADVAGVLDAAGIVGVDGRHRHVTLVVCAFNTFLNLSAEEAQQRCMHQVASLLGPDGVFVVESMVPAEPDEIESESLDASSVGHGVTVHTSTDVQSQIIRGEHREPTADGLRRRPWTARYLHPEQFDELADRAGLVPIHRWSSWQGDPFDEDSPSHITVYARAGTRS